MSVSSYKGSGYSGKTAGTRTTSVKTTGQPKKMVGGKKVKC